MQYATPSNVCTARTDPATAVITVGAVRDLRSSNTRPPAPSATAAIPSVLSTATPVASPVSLVSDSSPGFSGLLTSRIASPYIPVATYAYAPAASVNDPAITTWVAEPCNAADAITPVVLSNDRVAATPWCTATTSITPATRLSAFVTLPPTIASTRSGRPPGPVMGRPAIGKKSGLGSAVVAPDAALVPVVTA